MRVASAGKKTFRKRNEAGPCGRGLVRLDDDRVAERILNADTRRTREDEALLGRTVLSELVVSGILQKDSAEVRFRTEVARGDTGVECRIGTLGGFERAVTSVADERQGGNADAGRLRQDRDQVRTYGEVAGLHAAIGKAVYGLSRGPTGNNALVGGAEALVDLHGAFQPFGSEGRDVERVVVKAGKREGELVVAEPAGCVIANQRALLQSSEMAFEDDGVIHSAKV